MGIRVFAIISIDCARVWRVIVCHCVCYAESDRRQKKFFQKKKISTKHTNVIGEMAVVGGGWWAKH